MKKHKTRMNIVGLIMITLVSIGCSTQVASITVEAKTKAQQTVAKKAETKVVNNAVTAIHKALDKKIANPKGSNKVQIQTSNSKTSKVKDSKHKSALNAFLKVAQNPTSVNLQSAKLLFQNLNCLKMTQIS